MIDGSKMMDALRTAAGTVTDTIHEHREQGEGFIQLCKSLGIEANELTEFVESEAAKLNGSGTVDGALMFGTLIGTVVAQRIANEADGTPHALVTDGDLNWAAIGLLLPPHEVRTRMLRHLHKHGKTSPTMLASAIGEPLGNVSYHMRALSGELPGAKKKLRDNPLVKLVGTTPRRGAVEHFYVLTPKALMPKAEQPKAQEGGEADAA